MHNWIWRSLSFCRWSGDESSGNRTEGCWIAFSKASAFFKLLSTGLFRSKPQCYPFVILCLPPFWKWPMLGPIPPKQLLEMKRRRLLLSWVLVATQCRLQTGDSKGGRPHRPFVSMGGLQGWSMMVPFHTKWSKAWLLPCRRTHGTSETKGLTLSALWLKHICTVRCQWIKASDVPSASASFSIWCTALRTFLFDISVDRPPRFSKHPKEKLVQPPQSRVLLKSRCLPRWLPRWPVLSQRHHQYKLSQVKNE